MYMRLVQVKIKPEELATARQYYDERTLPALQKTAGCLFACLMQSSEHPDELISMTMWESETHADAYEKSGLFQQLIDEKRHLMAESSEWRVQLSKDLKLEYAPVPMEPEVKAYPIAAMSGKKKGAETPEQPQRQMFLRLFSIKLKPEMRDEYRRLYTDEVIPALQSTKGCRHAYLLMPEGESNEAFSITIWDSKEAVEQYERGETFARLIDRVKHTFTELYQWKLKLDKQHAQSATTDDVKVEHYSMVTGKSMR
jgi:quinol monooxygenase YgiN